MALELLEYKPQRWYPKHKLAVIKALLDKKLTFVAANTLYGISIEELQSWLERYAKHGTRALYTTKIQAYR